MSQKENNFAFIDAQNLYQATRGITLDYYKLREYLRNSLRVTRAIIFLGHVSQNRSIYHRLRRAGFELDFKQAVPYKIPTGQIRFKGNVDTEIAVAAAGELYSEYDKAVIVSGDGDFERLIRFLAGRQKLKAVVIPDKHNFSQLLNAQYIRSYLKFLQDEI